MDPRIHKTDSQNVSANFTSPPAASTKSSNSKFVEGKREALASSHQKEEVLGIWGSLSSLGSAILAPFSAVASWCTTRPQKSSRAEQKRSDDVKTASEDLKAKPKRTPQFDKEQLSTFRECFERLDDADAAVDEENSQDGRIDMLDDKPMQNEIQKNGLILLLGRKEHKENKQFILDAVKQNGYVLDLLREREPKNPHINDPDVIKASNTQKDKYFDRLA
jgi:hypothetical protein